MLSLKQVYFTFKISKIIYFRFRTHKFLLKYHEPLTGMITVGDERIERLNLGFSFRIIRHGRP